MLMLSDDQFNFFNRGNRSFIVACYAPSDDRRPSCCLTLIDLLLRIIVHCVHFIAAEKINSSKCEQYKRHGIARNANKDLQCSLSVCLSVCYSKCQKALENVASGAQSTCRQILDRTSNIDVGCHRTEAQHLLVDLRHTWTVATARFSKQVGK